jgi:hypothetical protein
MPLSIHILGSELLDHKYGIRPRFKGWSLWIVLDYNSPYSQYKVADRTKHARDGYYIAR